MRQGEAGRYFTYMYVYLAAVKVVRFVYVCMYA